MLLGSVEAGGTKFVCAVGDENYQIIDQIQFPTTTPEATLQKTVDYFKQFKIDALSIASFGPIEIQPEAPKYGYITTTPKPGWSNVDVVGYVKKQLDKPIFWTTDVNGSAYGEYIVSKKAHQGNHSLVYYTIGTGVGAGTIVNGEFIGGIGNPEMGHVLVKRHPEDADFAGICPYHQDCLEGLVAGPTFEARLNRSGKDVPLTDKVWDIMAYYVAQAALQATLTIRPNQIVFGGGVTSEAFLEKVRREFKKVLNDYVTVPNLDEYLVMPVVENNGSATVGNFALAAQLLTK
jgi:fructokinase